MSSFKGINRREVVGANIVISTAHHHRIFLLRDWNAFGYKARELAHAHDLRTAETLASILQ